VTESATPRPVANVHADDWDDERDRAGFRYRFLRLGERVGGDRLGAAVFELPPGQRMLYHCHHGNEELVVVLDGNLTVRTPAGELELGHGETMLFRRGREGAHGFQNGSDRPVRYVVFSTMIEPDVVEYLDTGKIGVFAGAAPRMGSDAPLELFLDASAPLDYYEREAPPKA
jgi:uncharacterized cupin superfamily protein